MVESAEIGILGVGEGAFSTIRETLRRIGVDEATLVREAGATFKQGVRDMIGETAQAMPISRKVSGRFAAAPSTADLGLGRPDSTIGAAG